MSDSNDDLLNYELGEDLDDQTLLAGDDDELFLSDEEIDQSISLEKNISQEQSVQLKNDAEEWVKTYLKKPEDQQEGSKATGNDPQLVPNQNRKIDLDVNASDAIEEKNDADESGASNNVNTNVDIKISETEVKVENDSVSERNIENVETKVENFNNDVPRVSEVTICRKAEDEECWDAAELPDYIGSEHNANQASGSNQFQESNEITGKDLLIDQCEEGEDKHERANIKQAVERDDMPHDMSRERYQGPRFQVLKRGRGIKSRGAFLGVRTIVRYPHIIYPQYQPLPNENLGPHMSQPYFSFRQTDQMNPRQPSHFLPNNQIQPRMEYRSPMAPNYRQQNPSDFNMIRCPRQEYTNTVNGNMFNTFPGTNNIRAVYRPESGGQIQNQRYESHNMCSSITEQIPGGRGSQTSMNYPNSSMSMPINVTHNSQTSSNTNQNQFAPPYVAQSVLPRKVLINPNFKGGVEAATSQLMKDTQFIQAISSHVSHLQSDEELLRQQEEFINKNRIHIEKRRHERSPERNRSRERSYSPPRRERRADSRERRGDSRGRSRRAGSRDFESRDIPRRRRSTSFDGRRGKEKLDEEEDAETRAYRMEIEKQKAMREKILRDKEMRRRRAAEEKQKDDDKIITDGTPQKLKPIIVTESKIISLKKKPATITPPNATEKQQQQQQQQTTLQQTPSQPQMQQIGQRTIPTVKVFPEKRKSSDVTGKDTNVPTSTSISALTVIKPNVKRPYLSHNELINDSIDDDMEDELLADTPSPPSSPTHLNPISALNVKGLGNGGGHVFNTGSRRVVLKSSKEGNKETNDVKKRVFDRLDKKVVIDKAVKRKIKRIVIKKSNRV